MSRMVTDPDALSAARKAIGTIPGAAYWNLCETIIAAYLAALSVPAAEQKAEPVRKVQKMARFCAEIAWDTAFAWAIDHGRTDQEAYDAASSVRENVLVHALQDDALSTQAIEARNAVIEASEAELDKLTHDTIDPISERLATEDWSFLFDNVKEALRAALAS